LPLLFTLNIFLRQKLHETSLHFCIHSAIRRLFQGPNELLFFLLLLELSEPLHTDVVTLPLPLPQCSTCSSLNFLSASAGVLLGLLVNQEDGRHRILPKSRTHSELHDFTTLKTWIFRNLDVLFQFYMRSYLSGEQS
jgi:hypothetical protein